MRVLIDTNVLISAALSALSGVCKGGLLPKSRFNL